ncbi:MAG: DUF547 domain-containing protein [Rubricoccaceae bacterium]|nr:DUF547 domain-containing protein [Rubricoccaceae bacterium]
MRLFHLFAIATLLVAACSVAPDAGPAPGEPGSVPAEDYEVTLTRILQAVVSPGGLVDYGRIREEFELEFDSVLAAVQQYDPTSLTSDEEKKAFLINAYNVMVLEVLRNAPEVQNIEFDQRFEELFQTPFRIAGLNMTLNQLENGILRSQNVVDGLELPEGLRALRPLELDPRIHVGLNCGAVSCPVLQSEAFSSSTIDDVLDEALTVFVNSERFARVTGAELVLSSIVDWFGEDFDSTGIPAGDYLLAPMVPTRPGYQTLVGVLQGNDADAIRQVIAGEPTYRFDYDWTVNRLN